MLFLNVVIYFISLFVSVVFVYQKYQRMIYWLGKAKHADPYPLPDVLPKTKVEWSSIALSKMAFGVNNEITVWQV